MVQTKPFPDADARVPRESLALTLLALAACALFAGFIALGTWQVHRLSWKEALIAHTHQRVHAEPVMAPGPEHWAGLDAAHAAYRHVRLEGRWLGHHQIRVWAATVKGSGYWIMTPLQRADGSIVLVNRGFAPQGWCDFKGHCPPPPGGEVKLTGLLRLSDPSRFWPHNHPASDTWYTRDVPAIAKAHGLVNVAPYFVDEDAHAHAVGQSWPKGGMTVIHFHNHHLGYLLTFYALALMVLGITIYVGYDEYRLRQRVKNTD